MFLIFSKEIYKIPFIESFLGDEVILYSLRVKPQELRGVIGWGRKKTALKAIKYARKYNLPYIALEDGFICSYGLRSEGFPPLSLIVDPVGIYYDATNPSLLETILNTDNFSKEDLSFAERALNLVLEHNLSKFNYQDEVDPSLFVNRDRKKVLVVDQTYKDLSVILGLADEETFRQMLKTAIKENPDADIYIKIHPEVISGKKRGYLSELVKREELLDKDNIFLITEDVNPLSLLKNVDKVYVVSSQLGFEALLLGKKVICFGMPFYAGWGLTEDKLECPRRRKKVNLLELFCGAYIKYCRYLNPKTGKRGTIFDVIDFILKQREWKEKVSKFNWIGVDFHLARKCFIIPFLKPYLKNKDLQVKFIKSSELEKNSISRNSVLLVWGGKAKKDLEKKLDSSYEIYTLEDGFIRSVGLGAEFVPPMSLVFDSKGIYYDPSNPSDLEDILNFYQFSKEELEKAEQIRKLIIENRITKYNIERKKLLKKPDFSRKIVLVPGQVEDDQAVLLSEGSIKTNYELLYKVKERNPDAYIIYKPHPDIVSKNRRQEKFIKKIEQLADRIEKEADLLSYLEIVDEVHTISSLSGFDALIREKIVFTYGSPFYAGWGLTVDELSFPRRKRRLTLQELVAGVLLVYPIYYDWKLRGIVDCETVIYRIIEEKKRTVTRVKSSVPKLIKKLLNYLRFAFDFKSQLRLFLKL